MNRVIAVERSKRSSKCEIRFEDGSALKAYLTAPEEYGLYPGRELNDNELSELAAEIKSKMARSKAAELLSVRPLSEFELKKRLKEKGSSSKEAEDAIQRMKQIGAVNDADYAHMTARRFAAKGYGAAKIKDELYKRGIPRELWDEVLEQYSANENEIDRFLNQKVKGTTDKKEIKKAADALYRRGFSWDEIESALERYKSTTEE